MLTTYESADDLRRQLPTQQAGSNAKATPTNRETAKWDPAFTKQVANTVGPLIKRWSSRRGAQHRQHPADRWSAGGVQPLRRHASPPTCLIFSPAFYDKFGYDRPIYTLGHYGLFMGPLDGWLRRLGVIEASRENAAAALHSGAVVLVFPGRGLRLLPTDVQCEHHRLQRPDRLRPDRHRGRACRSCRPCRSAARKPSCS